MLVEMRHAPDPRLLLEVALVQLTHEAASNDMSACCSTASSGSSSRSPPAPQRHRRARPVPDRPCHRAGRRIGGRARPRRRRAADCPRRSRARRPAPVARRHRRLAAARPVAAARPTPSPRRRRCASGRRRRRSRRGRGGSLVGRHQARRCRALRPAPCTATPRLLGERDGALGHQLSPTSRTASSARSTGSDVEAAIAAVVGGKVPVQLVIHVGGRRRPRRTTHGDNVVPAEARAEPAASADEDDRHSTISSTCHPRRSSRRSIG